MTEQIKELEKALRGSLMHENECAFVHTSTIQLCLVSLQAWDEVIEELEGQADFANSCGDTEEELGIRGAIDIIKQKLADIEEVR